MSQDDVKPAVYGEIYDSAATQQKMLWQAIEDQCNVGFESDEECARWAKEHLLDIVVIGRGARQYYYLTHRGDILIKRAWVDAYCADTLFIWDIAEDGKKSIRQWTPRGMKYHDQARINGEREDYGRQPIYHRDYSTPAGYYDTAKGTFNIAKPFPCYAKPTGRDTSHIYTYIQAVAGECYLHLLAWLRMKMCYPTQKTQVVPIIVSRAQGTGKTTFAEVICKGLFGKDNVLVTDQYDSQSRFNADYADALIVCHEEKEYEDKRNSAAALKSRATATTIRKENKGLDPVYQESYTDFIMTSNKDVPIKFDDDQDQRRFMIMEADENFTRKKSELADEVFTKLYGQDINNIKTGIPFVEDHDLISQFKHELFSNEEIAKTEVRKFPHTAAYERCFTLPRTTETTEIEAIVKSLAPFIKTALENKAVIQSVTINEGTDREELVSLSSYLQTTAALQYFPGMLNQPEYVALCRPLVFFDIQSQKPFAHANVERTLYDCDAWLIKEYGIRVYPVTTAVPGGFFGIQGRHRTAPTARFVLASNVKQPKVTDMVAFRQMGELKPVERIGERLRVNGRWRPDAMGEFETLNEMKPGVTTLDNKNQNVQYMDTFLFEADETTKNIYIIEEQRIQKAKETQSSLTAERLFAERLRSQLHEAERLFKQGVAARVVYSGGKSYHIVVRIADACPDLESYKWLHAHLSTQLSDKLTFDPTTADPARLTRAPIMFEREFEYHGVQVRGQQKPMHTNWNALFNFNWRPIYEQWKNRPLAPEEAFGRKLVPTKPEYREAMHALLHGTFWTDSTWNGRRQQCFFPGYRLCRYLGYSHEQLWGEGAILDGLDKYYKKGDIEYWRTRQTSEVVRKIDKDVEAMDEDMRTRDS
jgi:hypothetical protein